MLQGEDKSKIDSAGFTRGIIWVVTIGLVFFLMLFVHLRLYEYAFDDAYIHFRLIENWILKGDPYFNDGEPVKASSSSGWLVFLYLIQRIIGLVFMKPNLPIMVAVINSFFITFSSIIYYKVLVRMTNTSPRILIFLLFSIVYVSLMINSSLGLMETTATIAIVGLAFLFFIRGERICFTLFGITPFFRLELSILFAIIVLYAIISRKFKVKDILLFSAIGIIPIVIFDLLYYGTLIPNTVNAKSSIYSLTFVRQLEVLISRIANTYRLLPFFERFAKIYLFVIIFIPVTILGVYIYQLVRGRRNILGPIGLLFLLWGISVISLYLVSRVLIFSWYEPLYMIPLFMVIAALIIKQKDNKYSIIISALIVIFLFLQSTILVQVAYAASINPAYLPGFSEGARSRQYISVGKELYREYPTARLLTSEIGGIGHGFKGYILDSAGLVTPEVLNYPEITNSGGDIIPEFITDANPDIIVSYDIFIDEAVITGNFGNYKQEAYPVFLDEDIDRSTITTPWGDTYEKILWRAENLYVFLREDLEGNEYSDN